MDPRGGGVGVLGRLREKFGLGVDARGVVVGRLGPREPCAPRIAVFSEVTLHRIQDPALGLCGKGTNGRGGSRKGPEVCEFQLGVLG